MAGARITLEMDAGDAATALAGIGRQLDSEGIRLLLIDIGEYMLGATRDRAALEIAPDGSTWASLSPRYANRKAKARPGVGMLFFDNHMLGDQLSSQVVGDTLFTGTNAPQGAAQHFGSAPGSHQNIPARPWLGVSDQDDAEIARLVLDHLGKPIKGAAA